MNPAEDLGIAHFLAHSDLLTRSMLGVLLAMSLVSWYLMLSRALIHAIDARRGMMLLNRLPRLRSLPALADHLARHPGGDPLTAVALAGLEAGRRYGALRRRRAADDPLPAELLARDLEEAMTSIGSRLENGLTVLASIGSSAPFIGLLGTVWGVYHALVSIGLSGQGTLDKVAGPVGEALIMTALGLAVAIPAVLGYNALVRANRVTLARAQRTANALLAAITVGNEHGDGEPFAHGAVPDHALGAA